METAIVTVGAIVWLAMGGYAFGRAGARENLSEDKVGTLFVLCMLFGPAMFGMELALSQHSKGSKTGKL